MVALETQLNAARRNTLPTMLSRSAARFGDRVAIKYQDRSWTYQQLDDAVTITAQLLREKGVTDGVRVASYGKNSDMFVILFFGVLRAKAIHVPINFALTGFELQYMFTDSGAQYVFADADLVDKVDEATQDLELKTVQPLHGAEGSLLDEVLAAVNDPERVAQARIAAEYDLNANADDIAQLLYTSGTTSRPKGAMMSHQALLAEYVSCIHDLDIHQDDQPLIAMPLYHSAAMHVFTGPYLQVGATIRIMTAPSVPEILELVETEGSKALFLAPTVWVPLAQHPDLKTRDLSTLTKAYYGASIMPVTVLNRLREAYPEIGFYNCFGQSEMSPLCTVLRPEEHDERPASAGRAVLNVEFRVVDPEGNRVPVGEPGEIQYRSPHAFSGYWNKPEATQEAFQDGWFRSGDQVVEDEQGYVQVVDRIKDVINTGGIMVAPREVEDAIYQHEAVAEVAVVGLSDERWIEAIAAFVVLKDGHSPSAEEIQDFTRAFLAPYKVPKRVEFVAELPRNQSGKILKRELRKG